MELKEFIVGVLDSITDAIKEEQVKWNNGATMNEGVLCPPTYIKEPINAKMKREIERIHFDVQVTEGHAMDATGEVKGRIVLASAGAGVEAHKSQETVQRVSFDIPLFLPY